MSGAAQRNRCLALLALCLVGFNRLGHAIEYPLREDGGEVFGTVERIQTRYEDTLIEIARRYSLGYEELLRVNQGVDPWLPGEGTLVLIPGQRLLPPGEREGIVVNLPEHRLYYFPKPKMDQPATVLTYPVSVGKMAAISMESIPLSTAIATAIKRLS